MTIQREDLVAAAAVGLLQYRQIDPLLIFLLQRNVRSQREAMLALSPPGKSRRLHTSVVSFVLLAAALSTAVLFTGVAVQSQGIGALFFFTLFHALAAVAIAAWFKQRGFGVPMRWLTGLSVALAPLAVFSLQQVLH